MNEKTKKNLSNVNDFSNDLNDTFEERISKFTNVSKNPYCIIIDGYQVNFSYSETNESLYKKLLYLIYS